MSWRHSLLLAILVIAVTTAVLIALPTVIRLPYAAKLLYGFAFGISFLDFSLQRKTTASVVTALIYFAGIMTAWLINPIWPFANLMAMSFAVTAGHRIQPQFSFVKLAGILMVFAIGYDVVQVWATGNMDEAASATLEIVQIPSDDTATFTPVLRVIAPILIVIPNELSLFPTDTRLIGVGDIFIPAILVTKAMLIARRIKRPLLYYAAVGGYSLGLLLTMVSASFIPGSHPALLYLIPCISACVLLAAKRYNVLHELRIDTGNQLLAR